jgi:nucleoside-diphosphate-sugar epimerase
VKVLVTGSAGFIGQHLCAELRRRGHELVPFDRLA